VALDVDTAFDILNQLGKCPSISFQENLVSQCIQKILSSEGISFQIDSYGNILAHIEGAQSENRPVVFVAHMDHPGFEVDRIESGRVVAKALGGVPVASLNKTTKSFLFNEKTGERHSCYLQPSEELGDREVSVDIDREIKIGSPIVFDLQDFQVDGNFIRMRAIDDLAGCAAMLLGLLEWSRVPPVTSVYAVFTRAEEVGLIGARLLAKSKLLPDDSFVISVETSSVIPGVALGEGPVIRNGDATYTFDFSAENVLLGARERIMERDIGFKCQRQLMSAGSCEAGAFIANKYESSGIAFPLGNWHNAKTYIGDPEGGICQEYIAVDDFVGGVRLITEVPYAASGERFMKLNDRYLHVSDGISERLMDMSH